MFLFLLEEKKTRSAFALSVMIKVDCLVSTSGFHLRINFGQQLTSSEINYCITIIYKYTL